MWVSIAGRGAIQDVIRTLNSRRNRYTAEGGRFVPIVT